MSDTDRPRIPTERQRLEDLEETPHAQVFVGEPRTVRLELAAGDEIPAHRHPDRTVVCHVLEGELEFTLGEEEYTVHEGELMRFDGRQDIAPEAQADTTALLVLAPRTTSYSRAVPRVPRRRPAPGDPRRTV